MTASDLVQLLRERIGQEFDGECHLVEREAREIATALEALEAEVAGLRALIRECRLADSYAARTGDESRWDLALHNLCAAERGLSTTNRGEGSDADQG